MDSTGAVIEAFTELAPSYEKTLDAEIRQMWGISYHQFVDQFISTIPIQDGDDILDVATGTGVIPLRIAQRVSSQCRIVGLDLTPAMLGYAQSAVRAAGLSALIRPVCASGMAMPFGEGVFDVVTCGLGMHHMDGKLLAREMRRVLKPNGWLVMTDVVAAPFWRSFLGAIWLRALMVCFGMTHSHSRYRAEMDALAHLPTRGEWQELLDACGFVDVRITRLPPRRRFYPDALLVRARMQSPSGSG
jgi:ubiquinone/menaquinone biosynthesis C-methylase UbiE